MKNAFSAVIALLLLLFYAGSVLISILNAIDPATPTVAPMFDAKALANTMNITGGLVSALVISVLAIAKPGEILPAGVEKIADTRIARGAVGAVIWVYVLIWIVTGVAAYIVGNLMRPDKIPSLTTLGQAWIGLAITAGYSYFGLNQPQSDQGQPGG